MPLIDQPDSPELRAFSASIAGGTVNAAAPHLLNPTQAQYLLNSPILIDGARQKRRGIAPRGPNQDTFDRQPHGVFTLDNGEYRKLVVRLGNQLWTNTDSVLFWTRLGCTVSLSDIPYMACQGVGNAGAGVTTVDMLFMTGCMSLDPTSNTYASAAYFTAGGETLVLTNRSLRAAAFYQNRGWGVDDKVLFWSQLNRIEQTGVTVTAGTGTIYLGASGFDFNVAVTPTRDVTPQILIWRYNSVWLLDIYWQTDGYFAQSASSGTMDFTKALLRPIVQETGLCATRAVTWVPGGTGGDFIFLSKEGLRSLKRSLDDRQAGSNLPLSWPIQKTIDRINWDACHMASSIYHEGVVYTSVPIDGSTINNFTIAYDTIREAFWYADWTAENFTKVKWAGAPHFLYFQSTTSGVETLADVSRNGFHVYRTDTGPYDQFLRPVRYLEETRGLSFDREEPVGSGLDYKKKWNTLELSIKAPGNGTGATLAIGYKLDDQSTFTNFAYTFIAGTETGLVYRRFDLRSIRPGYTLEWSFEDTTSLDRYIIRSFEVKSFPLNQIFS